MANQWATCGSACLAMCFSNLQGYEILLSPLFSIHHILTTTHAGVDAKKKVPWHGHLRTPRCHFSQEASQYCYANCRSRCGCAETRILPSAMQCELS